MSGQYHILYWRDIPSMVKGKVGRKRVSRPLTERFMVAIDAAAMQSGGTNTDEYLADWKASDNFEIVGDADQCLDQAAARLETEFDKSRLQQLVKNGGWAANVD